MVLWKGYALNLYGPTRELYGRHGLGKLLASPLNNGYDNKANQSGQKKLTLYALIGGRRCPVAGSEAKVIEPDLQPMTKQRTTCQESEEDNKADKCSH